MVENSNSPKMLENSVISPSLSFNTHLSERLTEIAARVINEFRHDSDPNHADDDIVVDDDDDDNVVVDDDLYQCDEESALDRSFNGESRNRHEQEKDEEGEVERDDDDFEFSFMCKEPEIVPISADEIFYKGQIRPIFSVFGSDLLLRSDGVESDRDSRTRRFSLSKLLSEERDSHSCSSSEADELDMLPPGTYCVWKPKREEESSSSPGKCKKSSSTGSSSKRWRFRDLLHRSNSDGKDTFVFMTPSPNLKPKPMKGEEKPGKPIGDGKFAGKTVGVTGAGNKWLSFHQAHYARNRALKEGEKRRSYLPYRQDLVGFFINVNGPSRNLSPF